MSTIVYRSYSEPQLIETTTLKLKLASCMVGYHETKEKCHIQETKEKYHNQETAYKPPNVELSCWSSIQTLSNKQSSYINPLTKTSPRLGQESLELCTENLGSETGSDTIDINIMSLNSSNNSTGRKSPSSEDGQKLPTQMKPRGRKACNFPPPLTTMRNPNSSQLKPYREDGRLIIEAFETPSRNTYLEAERSNGRLILSFVNNSAYNFDTEMANKDNENHAIEKNILEIINQDDYEELDKIGKENIQIPGRYKENQHGNKSSCFWRKSLCVATS